MHQPAPSRNKPDEDAHASLAGRLRLIREAVFGGTGGPDAAVAAGVPSLTWVHYESGVIIPGEVLLAFMVATSAEPRWLLSGDGPMFREAPPAIMSPE